MNLTYSNLRIAIKMSIELLLQEGKEVPTSSWHAMARDDGLFQTLEILNHSFTCPLPKYLVDLKEMAHPNLPWVDKHFEERVSRIPYNPPPSYREWPYWRPESEQTKETPDGKFSHSYPERFWPPSGYGIRYPFGNLDDVVDLLARDPYTRQANFSIWSLEDNGSKMGVRVPCTLNYYFLMRRSELNLFYEIRSCDALRFLRDDIYMACRLNLWVLNELSKKDSFWRSITPGCFSFHVYSLHVLLKEVPLLRHRLKEIEEDGKG